MTASCPVGCGWTRDYALPQHARRGIRSHVEAGCRELRGGRRDMSGTALQKAAVARTRKRVTDAGYAPEATTEQWVARWDERPELYDDLLRVLCGTSLASIERDRRRVA